MLARRGDAMVRPGVPLRTCVGCRAVRPQTELLRVVAGAGVVIADPHRRQLGRGAWIHPDPACLVRAQARLPRALRVAGPLSTTDIGRQLAADGTTFVNDVTG